MGTDNPKVSAYVPQVLKDRLKKFREERDNISESQAVTIILAEYFQVPEVLGRSTEGSPVGGVTLARMEALEQTLTEIAKVVGCRLDKLDDKVEKISKLSAVHQVTSAQITSENGQIGSLPNELLRELPEQTVAINSEKDNGSLDELSSELSNESLTQELEQDILPSELGSEFSENEERKAEKDSIESLGTSEEQAGESRIGLPSELPKQEDTGIVQPKDKPLDELLADFLVRRDDGEPRTKLEFSETQGIDESSLREVESTGSTPSSNELQEERLTEASKIAEKTGEPVFSLLGRPPIENIQSEQIPLDLGAKEDSVRIDIDLLARRLGMAVPSVRNKKSKSTDEEFTEWTTSKDISKIGWKSVKQGKRVHYEPVATLDSEPLNGLLAWIRENGA